MQAVILGAGIGSRMGDGNRYLPKPLMVIGGRTVLRRQVGAIRRCLPQIDRITVVVGHERALMRAEGDGLAVAGAAELRYVEAPDYLSTNTATSLALALVADGDDTLLLNGDVLFDDAALSAVRDVPAGGLCEYKPSVVDEEVQVVVDDAGRVTRIGKAIGGQAEAVGVYRLSAALNHDYLAEFDAEADAGRYYEDVLNRLLGQHEFRAVPLPDEAIATEIDTVADLEHAHTLLPRQ